MPRHVNFSRILATVIVILLGVIPQSQGHSYESDMPFAPGEKLTFVLKWGKIPAGKAELEVLPVETLQGEQAYHFVLRARTNSFVDIFYKVRDTIEAYTDIGLTRSIFYKAKQREGNYKHDIVVHFDWEHQKAQYIKSGKPREPISIPPGSFDLLSAFYHVRTLDFQEDTELSIPVTDGKKFLTSTISVLEKETLKLSSGTYETYLVEPETKDIGGVFKKSKHARIHVWLTADERRMPVKIKSKVIVGSFVGELISAEGLRNDEK